MVFGKMQTKKVFPKFFLFFYLIPYVAVLALTALDCVFNTLYLQWYWLAEWMVAIPEMLAYYILLAMIYATFGGMAYAVFFGKLWQKITIPAASAVLAFLLPCLRYIVRHIGYGKVLTNVDMLDMYNEDVTIGVTMFLYAVLALIVILLERAYYACILRVKPSDEEKPWSPKHPVGISMMVFFGALMIWATVNFIMIGEFSFETVLSLILEYVIDISGFFISTVAAKTISKWNI